MHILVTGASGLVGQYLCPLLLQQNHQVWALSRQKSPQQLQGCLKNRGFHLLQGNVTDGEFAEAFFRNHRIDCVVHLAVERFLPDKDDHASMDLTTTAAYRTNYLGTLNMLQAAAGNDVKLWVQGSAMMVFDINRVYEAAVAEKEPTGPVEPNGFSVLLAEEACRYTSRTAALKSVILRFPGIYGRGKDSGVVARFAGLCREAGQNQTIQAPVNRAADFLYVEDAAAAIVEAIRYLDSSQGGSELFHIGSGQAITIYQLAIAIKEAAKAGVTIEKTSAGSDRHFYFDISKAQQLLGYQPQSLSENLRSYLHRLKQYDN